MISVERYLKGLENTLVAKKNIIPIELSPDWTNKLNEEFNGPGVYIFFEDGKPCYVGETGNIKKRMDDLRNTLNHSLRRNFGNLHFKEHSDFFKATSKRKFHPTIETLLDDLMTKKLRVSLLRVDLGRKELEEYLCETYNLLEKYNKRSRRQA